MRLQLDRNQEDSNEYRRKLELGSRDIKRLQDDLLNLTREHQTLHQELEHVIDDKENLKLQIQEYIKQVSNCENVIAQKVVELLKTPSESICSFSLQGK